MGLPDMAELYGYGTHVRQQLVVHSCPRCGALVLEDHILRHEEWHEQQRPADEGDQ